MALWPANFIEAIVLAVSQEEKRRELCMSYRTNRGPMPVTLTKPYFSVNDSGKKMVSANTTTG